MASLIDRHRDQIAGVLSCYDRVVIRGTLPSVCHAKAMAMTLDARGIRLFDYAKQFPEPLREAVRGHAERVAAEEGVEVEYIKRPTTYRKEDRIREILAKRGTHPGLVHVFSVMELCSSYRPWHDKRTGDLLLGHAECVVVCNVRGRDALRNANDRIDADEMSKRLHDGSPRPVFHGAPEMLTLKELVRCYGNLVEDATRVMLRVRRCSAHGPFLRLECRSIVPRNVSYAGEARGRRPCACRIAVEPTGCAERAAAGGKGRNDRDGTPAARLEGPAHDPVPRPGPGGVPAGDHAHAVAVPDEAEPVAVCRAGGGPAVERGFDAPDTGMHHFIGVSAQWFWAPKLNGNLRAH
jgi:hypothetical protein